MFALPPKADMAEHRRDVRFVPKADVVPARGRMSHEYGINLPFAFEQRLLEPYADGS